MLSSPSPIASQRDIYSVSRLNREARLLLGMSFPLLWVEGELSNLATPASGHLYFTLKDDVSCVRCAMFKNQNLSLRFKPRDGMQVLVRARVSLYEPRGEFQLTVEYLEEAGFGTLQRAFEALKQRLAAEGLFDPARKRALPEFPRRLGVITSPEGAALRDILSVLRRRFPALPVVIYPVPVQGEAAAVAITRALALATRRQDCDVLILARGGGSLEDLRPFNTETVARAIAACAIPVVSGVGHQIDFSIADFVADHRAATPTAAAELVSPDSASLITRLDRLEQQLGSCLLRRCESYWQAFDWMRQRLHLQHPRRRVQRQNQRLDELQLRLRLAIRYQLKARREHLTGLDLRVQRGSPRLHLARAAARQQALTRRLTAAIRRLAETRWRRLDTLVSTLDAISPLATLGRGYALVTRQDGALLRDSRQVTAGEAVNIRLAKGRLRARVTDRVKPDSDAGDRR